MIWCVFFFFYCSGDHRDLHSFPTRRSSDLHAIVAMRAQEPDLIVAARLGNAGGVVLGYGDGEMFVASDQPAILQHTRQMVFLEPGEMAVVTRDGARYLKLDGTPFDKSPQTMAWDPVSAAKGG